MGGFFGVTSKQDCVLDIFFGVDYHSHLGTRRGGMVIHSKEKGFQRQIHNIENTPFRTKFEKDLIDFQGHSGIGCISDSDPQPLLVRSHLGLYAITTVGVINNADELIKNYFSDHGHQFMAMSSGKVNATELIAALINQKDDLVSGILHAQEQIDGSATILILTEDDSIISSGESMLEVAKLLKDREARNIYMCSTFGLFTSGLEKFDKAYEEGPEYGQREIGKEKSGSSCLTEALIHKENQVVESYQQMENIQQRWYHRNYPMMKWENYRKLYAVCGDMEVLSMSPVVSMFM